MDWKLQHLPPYVGGEIQPAEYRCGCGMADDFGKTETPEDTTMQIVKNTTAEEFSAYCESLSGSGFVPSFTRDDENGMYREFTGADEIVYAYYTFCDKTARIIEDKTSVSLAAFSEDMAEEKQDTTDLMQFGLFYDDMVHGVGCDCGMNYLIRLRNNKLIIVDGGEWEQATQTSIDEYLKRVREITKTSEGDPIEVALWYCTHPHDDHMDYFIKLVEKYGDIFKVERVMFNFPAYSVFEHKEYVRDMRRKLSERLPDIRFLKPHTGQKFTIGNAEVDIIFTHEDLYDGTEASVDYGANTFSTVLRISFEGVSFLLLADADDRVGEILCERYDKIDCTFAQAAHHGINRVEHIYALVNSEYILLPESDYHMRKSERMRDNFATICKYNKYENIFMAGDYTVVFHVADGKFEASYFPIRGCLYDGT